MKPTCDASGLCFALPCHHFLLLGPAAPMRCSTTPVEGSGAHHRLGLAQPNQHQKQTAVNRRRNLPPQSLHEVCIGACAAPVLPLSHRCVHGSLPACSYKWDTLPAAQRPERGLLAIRAGLNAFANLRPAIVPRQVRAGVASARAASMPPGMRWQPRNPCSRVTACMQAGALPSSQCVLNSLCLHVDHWYWSSPV